MASDKPYLKPYLVSPGWKLVMHDLGLNVDAILRRADLPGDLFARDKAHLSTSEYFRLWQGAEDEAADPLLALRIGSSISVEAFDPPIFAALCSPNFNTALARLAHYKRLVVAMRMHLDVDDEGTSLELEWIDNTTQPPDALILMELVFFVRLARIGTRENICPLELSAPVLPKQPADFRKFLGTAIKRADRPRLRFSAADCTRPFLTANDKMWEFFEPALKKRLSDLDESASCEKRVQAVLLEMLPSGRGSIDAVAGKLGTSARTLQRRLKLEGFSFQMVLDHTREELAKHYLKTTAMTGAEISFLLGFEDPNSFFRAFSTWTGTTPERARRELTS